MQVYRGRVSGIMEFGCFVELQGFRAKAEGLVHLTNIAKQARGSAKDLVKRGQDVWVKVVSTAGGKLSLSMRDVDQATGQDLLPVNTERTEGGEVPNSIKGLSGARARPRGSRGAQAPLCRRTLPGPACLQQRTWGICSLRAAACRPCPRALAARWPLLPCTRRPAPCPPCHPLQASSSRRATARWRRAAPRRS